MSIFDHEVIEETHIRKPFKPVLSPLLHHSVKESGELVPAGLATQYQHFLKIAVGVDFWCNKAQYNDALKVARKTLATRLFQDLFGITNEMRHALMSADSERLAYLIDQIDAELMP